VSAATVRRLFADEGLDRATLAQSEQTGRVRRRWQAEHPGQLWHGDVCHGPALRVDGRSVPLRIHALLDDASRYVVAIRACQTERESDMLALFADAVRSAGLPGTLYLDNGSTYSGEMLATACGRLGTALVHARPYDPQARGKMERFWRTLRIGLLDHLRQPASLHEVQVCLLAWLEREYHVRPHGGLLGRTPGEVWSAHTPTPPDEARLSMALTARGRRRVRRDGTVSIGGVDWECDAGFLAGRLVTIARSLCEPTSPPWIEHEERRIALRPVDPLANARRAREPFRPKPGIDAVAFDPARVRLDAFLGRGGKP
jgi:transposase InsO family protein